MWQSPTDGLPRGGEPVAVWHSNELLIAKRHGRQWFECTRYGDVIMCNGGGPIILEPDVWAPLPTNGPSEDRRGAQR